MKFNPIIVKYLLAGSLVLAPKGCTDIHNDNSSLRAQTVSKPDTTAQKPLTEKKAQDLCDKYIEFVLQGQKNIKGGSGKGGKGGKGSYSKRVRNELPGAPVGYHCIFGQYTQLNRALEELGDTLSLIPFTSRNSCPRFRYEMQAKYSAPEYEGALHNGKMFKLDKDYDNALKAFLQRNHITDSTAQEDRQSVIERFEKNNFKASALHPGSILIIQKSGNPNNTHAVMFLGRGHIKDNTFIPDSTGSCLYAGYNGESVGDIFQTWRTDRIFAVDIFNIACVAYDNEFNKIEQMNPQDLYHYVYDIPANTYAYYMPDVDQLKSMARDKYFNGKKFTVPPQMQSSQASFALAPTLLNGNSR